MEYLSIAPLTRQLPGIRIHPVNYTLVMHSQPPGNRPKAHAAQIQVNRLVVQYLRIPFRVWLGRVAPLAALAFYPLCARQIPPGAYLPITRLAVWANGLAHETHFTAECAETAEVFLMSPARLIVFL